MSLSRKGCLTPQSCLCGTLRRSSSWKRFLIWWKNQGFCGSEGDQTARRARTACKIDHPTKQTWVSAQLEDTIGEFEMSVVPRSLCAVDGSLYIHADKASLMHCVEEAKPSSDLSSPVVTDPGICQTHWIHDVRLQWRSGYQKRATTSTDFTIHPDMKLTMSLREMLSASKTKKDLTCIFAQALLEHFSQKGSNLLSSSWSSMTQRSRGRTLKRSTRMKRQIPSFPTKFWRQWQTSLDGRSLCGHPTLKSSSFCYISLPQDVSCNLL